MESVVSIVKCKNIHNFDNIKDDLKKGLDLIGGLESLVCRGDTVIIKPNLIKPAYYTTGITTNLHLIIALCNMSRECGAKRIIIGEGAAVGYSTKKAFDETGINELAKKMKIELVDFKRAEWIPIPVPEGRVFHRLKLPRILMEADVVINVPVMKTHDVFPATLGLKNMKGVIQEADKKRFHKWGLSQSIVDLNRLVLPELTVIDGTVCMEGLGPTHGSPVNLGILISSKDTVAADSVAATIMGIDPLEIEYIKLAAEQNLGCADISKIEVVGGKLEEVKRPFKQIRLNFDEYKNRGIFVYEDSACTGCRHVMETLMINLEKKNRLDLLKGYCLVFGQMARIPSRIEGKLACIGICTKKYKDKGGYIPGCPPHPEDIVSFFEKRE